jgi:hypothetical protein
VLCIGYCILDGNNLVRQKVEIMSCVPIQGIMDTFVLCVSIPLLFGFYSLWPPLVILPIMFCIHWFIFEPILSDSFAGYMIGSSRWETWKTGVRKWSRFNDR